MAVVNDLIQQRAGRRVAAVAQEAPVRAAYLFGSQVKGTAEEFSGIDIAAFVEGAGQWDLPQRVRIGGYDCVYDVVNGCGLCFLRVRPDGS